MKHYTTCKLTGGFLIIWITVFSICRVQAQETQDTLFTPNVVIKTNLLYDLTTTFNLGMEFRLTNSLTFDIPFNYNPWTFSGNKKIKHWLVQPELRYWVNESFKGSFWGLHLHGAQFNTAHIIDRYRYEGWLAGAGVSYGYRWNLSNRWALEATIGAGYAYIDYTKYTSEGNSPEECNTCGQKLSSDNINYWGLTKAGLSLIYTIGGTMKKQAVAEPVYVKQDEVIQPEIPVTSPPVQVIRQDTLPKTPVVAPPPPIQYQYEVGNACVLFPVNQYTLLPEFQRNQEELGKIKRSVETVRKIQGAEIVSITIESYASPEGDLNHNIELSEKRAAALRDYMVSTYDLDAGNFVVRSNGENWEGLRTAITELHTLTNKERGDILRILDLQDLATRKALLKKYNGGKLYAYLLQKVYPALRISEYRIDYTIPNIYNNE